MIHNQPSLIGLISCISLQALFTIIHLYYWTQEPKNRRPAILSLWFLSITLFTLSRYNQFNPDYAEYGAILGRFSGTMHYFQVFLAMIYVNVFIKYNAPRWEKVVLGVWFTICIVSIWTSEINITSQVIIRETFFGEKFSSAIPGEYNVWFANTRPLILILILIRLIRAEQPSFHERHLLIWGLSLATLFILNDNVVVTFDLNWIRLLDYAYMPLGILLTINLIQNYFDIYRNMEQVVSNRTKELSDTNQKLIKEINIRKKTEYELDAYRRNLEILVEQRTEELHIAIQEQMQLNEELSTVNEALSSQRNQLENALNNLKQAQTQIIQSDKMAALGTLTAGVAHEINNPLNFITLSTSNLRIFLDDLSSMLDNKCETMDNEQKNNLIKLITDMNQLMDYVQNGSDRIAEIVKSFKIFTRVDRGEIQKINIHEFIDAALIMVNHQLKNRITVIKQYNEIPLVETYPGKINQILINLLTNAIDAIPKEGTISISTSLISEKEIEIIISDSGMGIPIEIQNKIYEPFFTTKEVGKGTGLGLSITYGIIEQLNGEITFTSVNNEGTKFRIVLPIFHEIEERR